MNILFSFLARIGISQKHSSNVLWNIASYAVIAIAGLLLNFVVVFYYDVSVLGVLIKSLRFIFFFHNWQ